MATYDHERRQWTLSLDSANRQMIDNWQEFAEFTGGNIKQFEDLAKRHNAKAVRSGPMSRYNCHGLTFAARRTCVSDDAVEQILKEDGYTPVNITKVLPGDVVVYYNEAGKSWHTGIVVGCEDSLVPLVCSKWGALGEVIHWSNQCPYERGNTRYYRITNGEYSNETFRKDPPSIEIVGAISFSQRS